MPVQTAILHCSYIIFLISGEKFLSAFFEPEENVCIRVFSDRRNSDFKGQKMNGGLVNIKKIIPVLKDHNSKNRGIFFIVNYGGQKPAGNKRGLSLVAKRCDFIKYCRENAAVLSEADWYAMITNLSGFQDGPDLIHELSKTYPGYSKTETDNKIIHFINSSTKPMNCRTIAEKGFKCSKLTSGECSCKSPASLIYTSGCGHLI
jgi:hypothetical protein